MYYLISLFNWNEKREVSADSLYKKGDAVVCDLGFGKHLGKVISPVKEEDRKDTPASPEIQCVILRKATTKEREKTDLSSERRSELMQKCRHLIKKYALPMKLVGVDISIDGGGIVFGFTAEERIDFRVLVRELSAMFQKSVRLQQIGSRDEAKIRGGMGPCGRPLCCLSGIAAIQSISTEMARLQQISHRGNERLSGCCNRLMCCLAFEQDTYEKMRAKLPDIGNQVKTSLGKGVVENLKILSQEVGVKLDSDPSKVVWLKVDEISKS
ncbi:MAG: stage 0 sporulation protein [Candidatus Moranbacteria bacterium]|nr:stage 0 sporulation protein [Candidatus Moranbacteria bacterium]